MTITTNLNDTKIIAGTMTDIVSEIRAQLADQRAHRLVDRISSERRLGKSFRPAGEERDLRRVVSLP